MTVLIEQKNGAGLYSNCDCRWDASTDGHTCVRWENETSLALVTVFGMKI